MFINFIELLNKPVDLGEVLGNVLLLISFGFVIICFIIIYFGKKDVK